MSAYTSNLKSVSLLDNVRDAFGLEASTHAILESHSWGEIVIINTGKDAGAYDIHKEGGVVTFIPA
jgi:hypothetical protein